jgi:2-succinyl-5-enolpyruvyl-6-hydroxy-3-cyclohexene-1-carboxylate synthase
MTPSRSSSPATDFSLALIDEYLRLGVRDVVLSPGSRSQALALVVAEYERRGLLRLRVRIDERVGGFLALGLAVETALPVLVITTSGTAVANLHPAVLEAHHSGVPLIILSADRPAELRGIGSNQTAQQPGIFGPAIEHAWDVAAPVGEVGEGDVAASLARETFAAALTGHRGRPGPVHANLAFREPLSGTIPPATPGATPVTSGATPATSTGPTSGPASDLASAPVVAPALVLDHEPGTVVVAGAGAGEVAETVARQLGVPLLAEITSGAHFGPNLVVSYRELLNAPDFGGAVRRAIVFGHPTLSREIPVLVARADVETIVVRTPGADDYNPGHRVTRFVDAVEAPAEPDRSTEARAWVGRWVSSSRHLLQLEDDKNLSADPARLPVDLTNAEFARRQLAIVREPVTRRMLVEAVWSASWPHDRLVFGASRLIREADRSLTGKRIHPHANRGLAGIDGTIATAIGIALASQDTPALAASQRLEAPAAAPVESSPGTSAATSPRSASGTTRVLLGDLTALHDVGALLFGVGEPRPRIQVIVGNDGGGTIFDGLEVAAGGEGDAAAAAALERAMFTAQNVNFDQLAAAYGWTHLRVTTHGELDEALASTPGPMLVEVVLAR